MWKFFGHKNKELWTTVDPRKIERVLGVTDMATRAAQDQQPPNDVAELSPEESTIRDKHREIAKAAQQAYYDEISVVEQRRQQATDKLDPDQFDAIYQEGRQKVLRLENEHCCDLIEAKRNEGRKLRMVIGWMERNGITQEAMFPESFWMHYAILFVMVVVEGMANATFFAEGSKLGFLGGMTQAFLVSGLNIGSSFFAGASFRWINMRGFQRFLAALGGAVYVVALPTFHLLIAHYRTALAVDVDTAARVSVYNLVNQPFGALWDLQNCLLITVGIALGIISAVEGYRSDDRIPVYGRLTRRYLAAREEYKARREAYYAAVQEAQDSFIDRLRQILRDSTEGMNDFRVAVSDIGRLSRNYENLLSAIKDSCHATLRKFHTVKMRVQGSTAQSDYFKQDANPFDIGEFELEGVEVNGTDPQKRKDELDRRGKEVERRLRELYTAFVADLQDFYAEVVERQAETNNDSPAANGHYRSRLEIVEARMNQRDGSRREELPAGPVETDETLFGPNGEVRPADASSS